MRIAAGVLLLGVTMLAVTALASASAQDRVPDEPVRTARFGDEALLARMTYAPPAVQPSAQRLTMPAGLLGEAMRLIPRDIKLAVIQPRPDLGAPPAFAPSQRSVDDSGIDAKEILLRIGPKGDDRTKGRWFVFAAGSGEAFGLNLIRNGDKGLRRAGWSVERLAEFGKAQVGVGWRRGATQVSLAASRREIGAYGISREDTVVGVTVSVKP